MEGGTENDLRILEQEEEEEQAGKPGEPSKKEEGRAGPGLGDGERKANDKDDKKEDGTQVRVLGLWVLPVRACEEGAAWVVVGSREAGTRGLCIGWRRGEFLGSVVEDGRGPLIEVEGNVDILSDCLHL